MAPRLIACPACECHAKSSESACPHCGAPLRRESNHLPRSATAVALGLSAVLTAVGCEEEPIASPVYGIAVTGGEGGMGPSSSSSSSGQGGMGGSQGGMGGMAGQGGVGGAGGMGGGK